MWLNAVMFCSVNLNKNKLNIIDIEMTELESN